MRNLMLFSDHELVVNYVNGEHACFDVLLKRHRTKVKSFIVNMVKDHELAEDLFQDTFIKVVNTLKSGKYNEEGKFLPWVMRIAHNLIIDHFRKEKRMPRFETKKEDFDIFSVIKLTDTNAEDKLMKSQLEKRIQVLIERLPKEQKEVLYMRHYADLSFQEIADQTNVRINTALGRMRYALINLRKMMKDIEYQFVD